MFFPALQPLLVSTAILLSSFATVNAATFYVATNGNDSRSTNQAQNRSTPWRSIQRAMETAGGGDEIVVLNGTYYEAAVFRRGGFNRNNRLVLRAENREGVRVIGSISGNDISYVTVEGFDLSNYNRTGLTKGISFNRCHHVTVRNNRVRECGGGGIAIDQSDWILVEWNITHDNANWNPDQHSGISIYQPQFRGSDSGYWGIQVRNNTSFGNENLVDHPVFGRPTDGNGIVMDDFLNTQASGNGVPYDRPAVVENNLCFDNGGQGIHCYLSQNVDIRNNTCVGNLGSFDFGGEITIGNSNRVFTYNNILSPREGRNAVLQYQSSNFWVGFSIIDGPTEGISFDASNHYTAPIFQPGSFELEPFSPGVDDGINVTGHFFLDLFGRNRFNGNIDIGAMERQ